MSTVMMYGPAPQPGEPRNPWTKPDEVPNPFVPGIQTPPANHAPFVAALALNADALIKQIEARRQFLITELQKMKDYERELQVLDRMRSAAFEAQLPNNDGTVEVSAGSVTTRIKGEPMKVDNT